MSDDLSDLYQEVILDHSKSPRNFGKLENANRAAQGHNPLCGDQVSVSMNVDNDVVQDIRWQGAGCAISRASASILTTAIKGKSKAEVNALFQKVRELVTTGKAGESDLGKLAVFAGVYKFPARVKCAILPWHAAVAAINEPGATVSTESEDT